MQAEFEVKTPSLAASTELLVLAPIRTGLVPTLDTLTYKSRVKALLKLLHAGRQSQHEYRPLRAVSDAVERVGVIRSLRVAVVEGRSDADDRILLSVHFDGSYEAYARTIWQRAARLLDLIFCNAEGYTTGWDHPFDDWNAWIRSVQVATPFFYATPGFTHHDQTYFQMLERRDRGGTDDERDRTRIAVPTAEEIAWSILRDDIDPTKRADGKAATGPLARSEALRQNLSALAGLFRLADWYRPGTTDGDVLRRAAHELLPQLCDAFDGRNLDLATAMSVAGGPRLAAQLEWFQAGLDDIPPARAKTVLPTAAPLPEPSDDVQGGILAPYDGVTDGAIVLVAFADLSAAAGFLDGFRTTSTADGETPIDQPLANLALTLEGLRACGLSQTQIDAWPLEFRQGMAARAGLLGDVRWNHPRRWTLPRRNGGLPPPPALDDTARPPVPLESVHAIVQFRWRPAEGRREGATTALAAAIERLPRDFAGVSVLSVQWLARQVRDKAVVDHFGYTDGQSQPRFEPDGTATKPYPEHANQVHLGEVLIGYANAADRELDLSVNRDPELRALMRNGSFLVVRKLRQDVAAFEDAVARTAKDEGIVDTKVRACMMGRWPADSDHAGMPLADVGSGGVNDFDYRGDPHGDITPLASHIRRANPREVTLVTDYPKPPPGGRAPRIMRRSLPYGPSVEPDSRDTADRGLMFMAYNASIAEQFEVIQGWLAGGNSSRSHSGAACPFVGVPEAGRERNFRFLHDGRTVHMSVDGNDDLGIEPRPLVTLQWGLYAFAPSRSAQARLAAIARRAGVDTTLPWSAERGRAQIERLRRVEVEEGAEAGAFAWKAALEDPEALARFDSASIWAAVRQLHGGLLRIPYGILVGTPDLVDAVLRDETHYTVAGYRRRLVDAGMGPIFLGRDADDPEYARLSEACNRAIAGIDMDRAFVDARTATRNLLDEWIRYASDIAAEAGEPTWELALDSRDLVVGALATLCEQWFGLDEATRTAGSVAPLFRRGALDWTWQPGDPVYYPGHFTASSRATFQPAPSAEVTRLAAQHGQALTATLRAFIEAKGAQGITAPVTRAVLDDLWSTRQQDAVHTIAGALMGFLPTTEGVLRRVLAEWTRDGTMLELAGRAAVDALSAWGVARSLLADPLRRAMKFRPVPEQIWREAKTAHRLQGDDGTSLVVGAGERLILGQVSATHAQIEQGDAADVFAVFGGRRGPGQPTHACPGYEAAIGAMIGVVAATLDHPLARVAASPSPGILMFRGTTPSPKRVAIWTRRLDLLSNRPGQGRKLLAFGDSWLRFEREKGLDGSDFMRALGDLGYDTSAFANSRYAMETQKLAHMRDALPSDDRSIYGELRKRVRDGDPPLAVLLGGGGNDFVDGPRVLIGSCPKLAGKGSWLERVLKQKGSTPAFDEAALSDFLGQMQSHLTFIVRALADAGGGIGSPQQVPIIVHAYDHPIPDGTAFNVFTCPWMEPVFARKQFSTGSVDVDAQALMAAFIDALNTAYAETIEALTGEGIRARFVRLTGVLAATPEYQQQGFKAVWKNELHPNKTGFAALAKHLHEQALEPLLQSIH